MAEFTEITRVRFRKQEQRLIRRAAKLRRISYSGYIRGAATAQAAHDLTERKAKAKIKPRVYEG